MTTNKEKHRTLPSADDVLEGLWKDLWRVDTIRSLDLESLSISLQAGDLLLEGHLASELSRRQIKDIARKTNGATKITDHLVIDHDLVVEVAQALAVDNRTRPLALLVGCDHGWIRLNGKVPDRESQQAAQEVAAQVVHVRGVVTLPTFPGEPRGAFPKARQPRLGSHVWGEDGEIGRTARVVIDPRNRLVSDIIMAPADVVDLGRLAVDFVVPVEAIEIANPEGVFLKHPYRSIRSFRAFDPSEYPPAPDTWLPPYPYKNGSVRWEKDKFPSARNESDTKANQPTIDWGPLDRGLPSPQSIEANLLAHEIKTRKGGAS